MGIEVMIYETYRSQDRQQELFNNGASKLRTVGVHHYGLACDIVRSIGGEPCWKGDFTFLGQLAQSCGLIWGGDWGAPHIKHSFIDSVHVQRCTVSRQGDLFAGVWYPDETYNPYDDVHHLFATANKQPAKAAASAGRSQTNSKQAKPGFAPRQLIGRLPLLASRFRTGFQRMHYYIALRFTVSRS